MDGTGIWWIFTLGHNILSYELAFRPIFRCEQLVLGSVIGERWTEFNENQLIRSLSQLHGQLQNNFQLTGDDVCSCCFCRSLGCFKQPTFQLQLPWLAINPNHRTYLEHRVVNSSWLMPWKLCQKNVSNITKQSNPSNESTSSYLHLTLIWISFLLWKSWPKQKNFKRWKVQILHILHVTLMRKRNQKKIASAPQSSRQWQFQGLSNSSSQTPCLAPPFQQSRWGF